MQSTLRPALLVIGSAIGATALAQTPGLRPNVQTASPSAVALDAQARFPSRLPSVLQPQVRTPVRAWKFNPATIKLSPQSVANLITAAINQKFQGKSVGYSVTVIMPGGASAEANGGMARRDPDSAPRGWTGNDRISIASVSKTITAATLIKLAAKRGVSLDSPAWKLLPPTWTYSPTFRDITLRQLLAHNSGIRACGIDYDGLKACAAAGVKIADKNPGIPIWTKYSNANYALMRLMIDQLEDNAIPPTPTQQGGRYTMLVNVNTLAPAGVGNQSCAPPAVNPALSYISAFDDNVWNSTAPQNYNWTKVLPGQPWGSMIDVCGSQGWNLSSRQLATFVNALMFTDKILPQTTVEMMRDEGLGLMYFDFGGGLTAYGHGGYHPAPNNKGEVNTLILGFNNGISVGLVINSRYKGSFSQDVAEAIRANAK
ncbi:MULTISPECIES: serine hydrolase domain-containing protein [Sphingomonas]|uniref:serine hydrolase domain-containing protein n=1 Tax=Sphingomonas TaxID=13687 RepID=UPI00082A36AE|nr:serine hydrolase domain-containing protein [Sphingomonas sp. CCH10-B3]